MKVLVVGDVMVDRYTYVSTSREAPEAPILVWDEVRTEQRPGGAFNTAANVLSLAPDAEVHLAGIVGERDLRELRDGPLGSINCDMVISGQSMVKHRYVEEGTGRYLFRHDNIARFDAELVRFFASMFGGWMYSHLAKFDAVIVSDYDKGTVDPTVVRELVRHPLVIVDSKRRDLRTFDGCRVLKINEDEYSVQLASDQYPCFERFFEYCVVTKGPRGAELRQCEPTKTTDRRYVVHSEEFPTRRVVTVDVTGCGDTHTAAMAVSLIRDGDVRKAVRFANEMAGRAVQRFGTCTVETTVV